MTEPVHPDIIRTMRNPSAWKDCCIDTRNEAGPSEIMDAEEIECMNLAGRDAGGYLMHIGKTDMASMTKEEWQKFCSVLIVGYELHRAARKNGIAA